MHASHTISSSDTRWPRKRLQFNMAQRWRRQNRTDPFAGSPAANGGRERQPVRPEPHGQATAHKRRTPVLGRLVSFTPDATSPSSGQTPEGGPGAKPALLRERGKAPWLTTHRSPHELDRAGPVPGRRRLACCGGHAPLRRKCRTAGTGEQRHSTTNSPSPKQDPRRTDRPLPDNVANHW